MVKPVAEDPNPRWDIVEQILRILLLIEQLVRFFGGVR
jgi:hypothetical protein